jgi:hypothetical protein
MTFQRNSIATKAGVSLALLLIATVANAASIGTVTELDGNLLVSRANGSVKVLGLGSAIEQGDVLTSRSQTYVTLTLADDSAVTLGPDTNLKVFYKHTPDNDGALLALGKGSVRITTGLLGTRSGDAFTLATPTSTLDIRGASAVVEYVPTDRAQLTGRNTGPRDPRQSNMVAVRYSPDAAYGLVRTAGHTNALRLAQVAAPGPTVGSRAPGLYVQVLDGMIHVTNAGGSQNFSAGQFGFTPNFMQPPVVLPRNPGLQFSPPVSFSSTTTPQSATGPVKSNQVDCEVR